MAAFHDLDSPYFGILRYDVAFDPATRCFLWLGGPAPEAGAGPIFAGEYVTSPTGRANRLLSELAGEDLVATNIAPTQEFRVIASSRVVAAVNRSAEEVRLAVPFAQAEGDALTADGLGACLPGEFRVGPLQVETGGGRCVAAIPPCSVAVVRRGS